MSESSPKVVKLASLWAAVRIVSLKAYYEDLDEAIKRVNIGVSAVETFHLKGQIPSIDAAKRALASVKRFIPCDYGTATAAKPEAPKDRKRVFMTFQVQLLYLHHDVVSLPILLIGFTKMSQRPCNE